MLTSPRARGKEVLKLKLNQDLSSFKAILEGSKIKKDPPGYNQDPRLINDRGQKGGKSIAGLVRSRERPGA